MQVSGNDSRGTLISTGESVQNIIHFPRPNHILPDLSHF